MSLGEKIVQARKSKGIKQEDLARQVGMSGASFSSYENDGLKTAIDPRKLIDIAKALGDDSILSYHCETCPIRNEIFIRRFPELNNINTDPTVIVMKVRQELQEGIDALAPLAEKMLTKDFKNCPEYQQVLSDSLVQIMGTAQSLDILVHQFLVAGILSPATLKESLERLQVWCEHRGHHHPVKDGHLVPREGDRRDPEFAVCPLNCDQRSGQDRRTGTGR